MLVAGSRIVIYILYLVSTMMLGFHILGVRTVEAAAYCHMPVTLWQRQSACSTSQLSGFFYNWSFLVVDDFSIFDSPRVPFPGSLETDIIDY